MMALLVGVAVGALAGGGAYLLRWLDAAGALAAGLLGALLIGLGGWAWVVPAAVFFVTSSFWSRWRMRRKSALRGLEATNGPRDARQVLANGGVGALCLLGGVAWGGEGWYMAFLGTFSTAAADTWATEIGTLARAAPRSILSGRAVAPGTSGGVSLLGWIAAGAGAWTVALTAVPFGHPALAVGLTAGAGWLGAAVDSLLGATLQARYRDPASGTLTERRPHPAARAAAGVPGFDNDVVNALATLAGALIAAATWWAWGGGG